MNWFKRLYVTSSSWENEQTIFQDEDKIRINGISKYFFRLFHESLCHYH